MTPRNAEIIRLRKDGLSFGKIAEALGVSRSIVAGVVNRAGLCESGRRGHPVTFKVRVVAHTRLATVTETARAWGVHRRTIYRWKRELAA